MRLPKFLSSLAIAKFQYRRDSSFSIQSINSDSFIIFSVLIYLSITSGLHMYCISDSSSSVMSWWLINWSTGSVRRKEARGDNRSKRKGRA